MPLPLPQCPGHPLITNEDLDAALATLDALDVKVCGRTLDHLVSAFRERLLEARGFAATCLAPPEVSLTAKALALVQLQHAMLRDVVAKAKLSIE